MNLMVIFSTACASAGLSQISDSRPPVTGQWKNYVSQVDDDSTKRMIELKSLIPGLVYDLRYATKNNFMHRRMYPAGTKETYLRGPAALALQKVQEELNRSGLGLKIWDAYRPYSVTVHFWELVKDERYVANPSKGSGHNRGIAVDLTIIDLTSGRELDMGTGYDHFSDTAHHTFTALPGEVLKNRSMLSSLMQKHGFKALVSEWWHYYLPDGDKFEVLDIDFRKFKKSIGKRLRPR
jgi:D-alanyl-D-alanine dipeptidase